MSHAYDLERFATAQEPIYETVRAELRAGQKRTHWMWFIFPQFAGLGHSPTAEFYAVKSRSEAEAYLGHPLLGERLRECTRLALSHDRSVEEIFGYPDHMKFRSSMTLFAHIAENERLFTEALRHFGLEPDPETLARL